MKSEAQRDGNFSDGLDVTKDEFWQGMRDNEFILVDAPGQKLAVFPNDCGMVVVAAEEMGSTCITTLDVDDIDALVSKLIDAKCTAAPVIRQIEAQYETHCAIENAKDKK